MKIILKFVACGFLPGIIISTSCKKEYSCENCSDQTQPPIARAGNDTTITLPVDSLKLDGGASTDPGGTITAYQWRKVSGPVSFNVIKSSAVRTVVKNLVAGSYQFELQVTDNRGLTAKDTMQITVDSSSMVNHPPVANAGADQTIILPVNMVTLDGSGSTDPDNNITSYAWTRISGPSPSGPSSPNAAVTQVTNLVQGVYEFQLKVTDAAGLFSMDTVQVKVNVDSCGVLNRPLINAQLILLTNSPQDSRGVVTVGSKIFLLTWECPLCDDTAKKRAHLNIYDVNTQTWSLSQDYMITPRLVTLVAAGGKIFFCGGYFTDGLTYAATFSNVDIYDIASDSWSSTSLSAPRYNMTPAVVNNKVLFAGGISMTSQYNYTYAPSSVVDIYDLTDQSWSTANLSEARFDMSAVTLDGKVYFGGGKIQLAGANQNTTPTPSDKVDIYDAGTGTWSTSSLTEAKSEIAGIAFGEKIFWAGGVTSYTNISPYSPTPTEKVEIDDVKTGDLSTACLFQPNASAFQPNSYAVAQRNSELVFFTGIGTIKNKFDIYDTSNDRWSIGVLNQDVTGLIFSIDNTLYVVNTQIWKLEF